MIPLGDRDVWNTFIFFGIWLQNLGLQKCFSLPYSGDFLYPKRGDFGSTLKHQFIPNLQLVKAVSQQKYLSQLVLWNYTRLRKHLLIATSWSVILVANWGHSLLSGVCGIWSEAHHGFLMRASSTNTYSVFDSGSTLYWFKRIFILILIIYCHCKGVVHYHFKRFGGSHVTVENFLRPWAFIQQGRPIPSCPLFQPQESFRLRVCQPLWWVSILHWKMSYHSTNGFLYPCSIIFHAFNTGLVSSKKSNHSFICLQRYNVHKIYDDSGFIFSCPSPASISLPEPAYAQGRHQAIKPLSQI